MMKRWLVPMVALTLVACSDTPGGGGGGTGDDTVGADVTGGGGGGSGFQAGAVLGVEVTPAQVSFGVVAIGSAETQTLEIFHSGTSGTLELSRIEFVTESGTDLSLDTPTETALGVGETLTLTVRYAPTDAVQDRGTVHIET
ncbi:MAG: hypothetical protein QF464_16130, partial [Myxococcota bacterium]|nr:hypothetical protein [Myxococcota bacterium]